MLQGKMRQSSQRLVASTRHHLELVERVMADCAFEPFFLWLEDRSGVSEAHTFGGIEF